MEITNEMIYEMLKESKDSNNRRFEQIDQRFEQIEVLLREFKAETNRRFEQMDRRFERIEALQMEDHRILMNLWEQRDNMKLSYTRTLLTMTGVISGVVAMIVSFITGKAIIYKS
ncbi:hypothetical protein HZA40_02635 [Candidatus Peregrinibacteria bacterium]|nr:hypothetical protein [Candidatus Peregrinibacteria bacterium]